MLKKCNNKRAISGILLFAIFFIAFAGIFAVTGPYDGETNNTMHTQPIYFTEAVQVRGGMSENSTNLKSDEKIRENLVNWRLFDVWLLRQISMNIFYVFFYNCLLVFFMIVPFFLIGVIWKNSKDGKKRDFI